MKTKQTVRLCYCNTPRFVCCLKNVKVFNFHIYIGSNIIYINTRTRTYIFEYIFDIPMYNKSNTSS